MAKKKTDENPFTPPPATEIKPAELVAENISPATDNSPAADPVEKPPATPPEEKSAGENAPPINPPENTPPVAETPAPEIPAATTVTASQLVSEEIPPTAPQLPPLPGSAPKKGRGRPSIPYPECRKCGRKHKPGPCANDPGASQIVIPGNTPEGAPGGEIPHDNPIEEKPAVNYRQMSEVIFDLSTNTAAAFIGPEWRAEAQERESMLIPLETYLRAQEMKDIPPGAVLCFAIAGYAAVRLRHQNTRSKIQLAWLWIKSKMPGKKKQFVPTVVKNPENPFAEKN